MTTTITRSELMSSPPPQSIQGGRTGSVQPSGTPAQKNAKLPSGQATPRVDVEPIYTALKQSIGDNWQLYKATVAEFVLGKRNQAELSWIIDPFLRGDPQRESLHNQLIMSILANSQRDPPEQQGVAVWVAATDKPAAAAKPVTGDVSEQKLKSEVMGLPGRERHRLKNLIDDAIDGFAKEMQDQVTALQINIPQQQAGAGGSYSRTNWEPEIRKRYAQPLFVESNEFPDPDSIQSRMLPICYEEGVFNGFAPGAGDFMNMATEHHLKDFFTRVFASTRANGPRPQWIKTGKYKRRLAREEEGFENGEIRRNVRGLLPVEMEAEQKRMPLSLIDLRLNLELGGTWLAHKPTRSMALFESTAIDDEAGMRSDEDLDPLPHKRSSGMLPPPLTTAASTGSQAALGSLTGLKPPLTNGVLTNGVHVNGVSKDVEMVDVNEDHGWQGGADADRMMLDGLLDDCLAGL